MSIEVAKATRLLCTIFIVISSIIVAAQETSTTHSPQESNSGFELVEYSMSPVGLGYLEGNQEFMIKLRFHSRPLSGVWIGLDDDSSVELEAEDDFVFKVLSTYRNIESVVDLEPIFDNSSYVIQQKRYEDDPVTALYHDSMKYIEWNAFRLFSLIRYGNYLLMLCDVRTNDGEKTQNVFLAVLQNDSYFLADSGSAISDVDAIIGSFLGSESYNGEIWKSLRSRAGIAE